MGLPLLQLITSEPSFSEKGIISVQKIGWLDFKELESDSAHPIID